MPDLPQKMGAPGPDFGTRETTNLRGHGIRSGYGRHSRATLFLPLVCSPFAARLNLGLHRKRAKRPKVGRKPLLLNILGSNSFIIKNLDPVLNSITDCKQIT